MFSGGSISTAGNGAYAVVAESGGSISLSGTTISTVGNGSGGLGINGSGSEIDAAGVTIATTGAMDPVTGLHSYGVYNGPFGEFTSGGVAKLTDVSISTQGVQMYGVITSTGATTSNSRRVDRDYGNAGERRAGREWRDGNDRGQQ